MTHLDECLLHLHGVEAIQRVDDLHAGLWLVVEAGDPAQTVDAPGLVPADSVAASLLVSPRHCVPEQMRGQAPVISCIPTRLYPIWCMFGAMFCSAPNCRMVKLYTCVHEGAAA